MKLKFKDSKGEKCVLTRSLELIAKRDRSSKVVPQLRTLDAIIQRDGKNLVSSKCAEIDSVMLDLLGVSKAVLSDVIFCHQEDSNWPLSESKILKEKFDQLFGADGYVKALKRIKDDRTANLTTKKECEGELLLFDEQKQTNDKYQKDLAKQEASLRSLKEQANQLISELKPVMDQLKDIAKTEKNIIDIEKEISQLEGESNSLKTVIKQLKRAIREPFKGTEDELKKQIDEFMSDLQVKKEKIKNDAEELASVESKLNQISFKMNKVSVEKGKLEAREVKFRDDKEKLKNLLNRLSTEFEMDVEKLILSLDLDLDSGIQEISNKFKTQEAQLEKKSEGLLQMQEVRLKKIEADLEDLRSTKNRLEGSMKIHKTAMKEKESEMTELKEKLDYISESASQLVSMSQEIDTIKDELERLERKNDLKTYDTKINRLKETIADYKSKLDELRKEKDNLQSKSQNLAVLKLHKENRKKALDIINDIEYRQESLLKQFSIDYSDPEKSFLDELKNMANKINRRITAKERAYDEKFAEKQKISSQLSVEKMKLADMKKEIKDKERKILSICGSNSYHERVKSVETELKSLRVSSGSSNEAEYLLTEFSEFLEKESKCPICKRGFDDKKSCQKVINDVKHRIDKIPHEAKENSKRLEELEQELNQLIALKSANEFIENSKTNFAIMNKSIASLQEQFDEIETEVEKLQKDLKRDKSEVEKIKSAQPDGLSYDTNVKVLCDCDQAIKKLSRQMDPDYDDSRSIEEITEEIEKIQSLLNITESELESIHQEKSLVLNTVSSLKEELLIKENEKLDVQKGQQSEVSYRNKISELKAQISDCDEQLKAAKRELQVLEPRIEKVLTEKSRQQKLDKHEYREIESLINQLKRCHDEYRNIIGDIKKYSEDDIKFLMDNITEEFDEIQEQTVALQSKKGDLTKSTSILHQEVNQVELIERNLKDNLELMQRTAELDNLTKECDKKKIAKGESDLVSVLEKKQQLEKTYQTIDRALQHCKGKQDPIVTRIRELKTELEKEKYKNSTKNFNNKLREVLELDLVIEDLNKFYKAFDNCVLIFHRRKMEEINRYLFKLWKQAYRGNDIDYIKIMSDSEGGLASDKRRTFNYRVVMVRDRVEMDMRGRCSAGQKVIASLVMRLALAEIFSVNCGILTLDEPTTNLDKENIQAFADSIVSIVRSHQKGNFQLIIITHDDQFLKCLKDSNVEYYYCVEKDFDGYSTINKMSIKEKDD